MIKIDKKIIRGDIQDIFFELNGTSFSPYGEKEPALFHLTAKQSYELTDERIIDIAAYSVFYDDIEKVLTLGFQLLKEHTQNLTTNLFYDLVFTEPATPEVETTLAKGILYIDKDVRTPYDGTPLDPQVYLPIIADDFEDGEFVQAREVGEGSNKKITFVGTTSAGGVVKVTAVSTANINLLDIEEGGAYASDFDGVHIESGDKVLVRSQTIKTQNGIYNCVLQSGVLKLVRAAEANNIKSFVGMLISVTYGTIYKNTLWLSKATGEGTLGQTNIEFREVTGASPSAPTESAIKVKAITTGNINLSNITGYEAMFDGYTTLDSDKILVANQTDAKQNGVYKATEYLGYLALNRDGSADSWAELIGALCVVEQGVLYHDTLWLCVVDKGGALGINEISFVQIGTYPENNITVKAATTANIDGFPYLGANESDLDLVFPKLNDLVLVLNQTDKKQNGIYVFDYQNDDYHFTRYAGADTWAELLASVITVSEGRQYKDSTFVADIAAQGEVGTNEISFRQVSGQSGLLPPGGEEGQVLTKKSNTDFDVKWAAKQSTNYKGFDTYDEMIEDTSNILQGSFLKVSSFSQYGEFFRLRPDIYKYPENNPLPILFNNGKTSKDYFQKYDEIIRTSQTPHLYDFSAVLNKPTYKTNFLNGQPVFSFYNSKVRIEDFLFNTSASEFTLIVVVKAAVTGSQYIITNRPTAASQGWQLLYSSNGTEVVYSHTNSPSPDRVTANLTQTNWNIVVVRKRFVDNLMKAQIGVNTYNLPTESTIAGYYAATTVATGYGTYIGGGGETGSQLKGYIADILPFNSHISDSLLQTVVTDLANKFNITVN